MWYKPVYKKLAVSELGTGGHTSGIVPATETQEYFGTPRQDESHLINVINIEFWFGNKSKDIKTNVNYFSSSTHHHIHLTGNLLPTYKTFGAEIGDIVVFWKSEEDPLFFKAELIKKDSERWDEIDNGKFLPKAGGSLELTPPGFVKGESEDMVENEYQVASDIESEFTIKDFPAEKRKDRVATKERFVPIRSKIKGDYALRLRNYKCQINEEHETFLTPNALPYLEKHHLIEMKFYDKFEYNIDDISNIIALCPICHRKIHYGKKEDVSEMVSLLWEQQKELLRKANIYIDLEKLKENYNC
jgi:hypothetical protein